MIVDDHPLLGVGTKRLIDQETDMKATFAMSGQEALLRMQEEKFDLFIYDMHLPDCDGCNWRVRPRMELLS